MRHINAALFVPHEGCPQRCVFCNQAAISGSLKKLTANDVKLAALTAAKSIGAGKVELAFFGGSFTAIDKAYMSELLKAAQPFLNGNPFSGIRISTRPDCVDDAVLKLLFAYGVTAIELGAQSMDNRVLQLNERGHSAEDIVSAVSRVKSHGFTCGLQMMTGMYGDTPETSIKTAEKIIELLPDSVRIYPTIVLKDSVLHELFLKEKYKAPSLEDTVSLCAQLLLMFHRANIPVIRMGLHSGGGVAPDYIAGAYHPAFKELCEGEIYLKELEKLISRNNLKPSLLNVFANSGEISKVVGHKGINKEMMSRRGYILKVKPHSGIQKYKLELVTEE